VFVLGENPQIFHRAPVLQRRVMRRHVEGITGWSGEYPNVRFMTRWCAWIYELLQVALRNNALIFRIGGRIIIVLFYA